jgi:hypothetical protein
MEKRKSRYVVFAELALELCKKTLPPYSHPKSPHFYTLPQLVACDLLMVYLRKTYRDMEEFLLAADSVVAALQLSQIPDYTTLYRASKYLKLGQLDKMYRTFLDQAKVKEEEMGIDATGFRPTQASVTYLSRKGQTLKKFYKGAYMVGISSQYILAASSSLGPGADNPLLPPLRRKAHRYARGSPCVVVGDQGFDGKDIRPGEVIPPQRHAGVIKRADRIEREELFSLARLEGLYGQRWKCETVNSVIKRKLGDEIHSHLPAHRLREPVLKGLVYNLHVR